MGAMTKVIEEVRRGIPCDWPRWQGCRDHWWRQGHGGAYVRGLLAEGARVVAADLSWNGVEVFRDEVKAAGGLPCASGRRDHA